MFTNKDYSKALYSKGQRLGAYKVVELAPLPNIQGMYYALEHEKTKASHIHIACPDKENVFAVGFKTVPYDSTGIAHILEHTVLCGSQRYPVRDPFFSMIKRSLNTFMNAFTASDWTLYPFASQNKKDFYNLLSVYLDAVFFPKLDILSFRQEGHRLEFDDKGVLQRMGVVYNEMKGSMSSQSSLMNEGLLKALYPDTCYRHNSGGDPQQIANLRHKDLLEFHARHYHPSNACFFTYGDMPLEEHLLLIEKNALSSFTAIDPETEVSSQPRRDKPRFVRETYPALKSDNLEKSSQVAIAWLISDISDVKTTLAFSLLSEILLGNAGAPLRKALMDSDLGTALCDGSGFDSAKKDTYFCCGLKGVAEKDALRVERLVFETLDKLVKEGIDKDLIDIAIHQLEFYKKEIRNKPYPYGLGMLLNIVGVWIHGGDPLSVLDFDGLLEEIRREMEGAYFEGLIERFLLSNSHRISLVMAPDTEKQALIDAREREDLDQIEKNLKEEEKEDIRKEAGLLKELQESKEDISCLPSLEKEDIESDIPIVKPYLSTSETVDIKYYNAATSGIVYTSFIFGSAALKPEHLELLPLFSYALSRMGNKDMDYVELARKIEAVSGGLSASAHARSRMDNGELSLFLSISSKALEQNLEPMLGLIESLITGCDFSDKRRLSQLLLEYRASMESMLIRNAHRFAISLSSRNMSYASYFDEIWNGVHYLKKLKDITDKIKEDDQDILHALQRDFTLMAEELFKLENLKVSFTADASLADKAVEKIEKLAGKLDRGRGGFFNLKSFPYDSDSKVHEAWLTSSAVNFVAESKKTFNLKDPYAPALAIAARLLRSSYLHGEIREKGGAYGAFALYNSEEGIFSLASYRDPHIARTLDVFNEAFNFLVSGELSENDIKEALLQLCSDMDSPDTPAMAAQKAFIRDLLGISDELRAEFKRALLLVDVDKIRELASLFLNSKEDSGVAVISSLELFKKEKLDPPLFSYDI